MQDNLASFLGKKLNNLPDKLVLSAKLLFRAPVRVCLFEKVNISVGFICCHRSYAGNVFRYYTPMLGDFWEIYPSVPVPVHIIGLRNRNLSISIFTWISLSRKSNYSRLRMFHATFFSPALL